MPRKVNDINVADVRVIFALSGAIGPVIGQNFGAGRMDRVRQAYRDGLLFCGRQLPHGRPAMTIPARSLVLMLHWVDSDFPDAEMDRS